MSTARPTDRGPVIATLAEQVKNQIAAGEVIERPASVVKELVENALDAGAGQVRVDLEEGGVGLVRVVDDGCGMAPADLALAFAPHATSKLSQVDDLDHIATLGFRGEALASIGSVARCRILSRPGGVAHASEVRDEGGRVSEVRDAGGAEGTTIEVRDLFYNTPARRRFLKTTATELARCLDVVQRLALAHAGVGFVVTHDGRRLYDVEAAMGFRDRIRRTFGAELAEELAPVEATDGDLRLTGFVAPPRFSRRDTARQMWFLNGRFLRDRVLVRVLKDAYRGFLVEGRQPVGFLALSMDPAKVDVNVHPAKAEVRFREQRRLFGFLVHHVREAVRATDMATPGERLLGRLEARGAWSGPRADPAAMPGQGALPLERGGLGARVREAGSAGTWTPATPPGAPADLGAAQPAQRVGDAAAGDDDLRGPFLQIDRTYLVRGLEDGFEIIDQHALHERLTFEELKRDVRAGRVEIQRLLMPEVVDVTRSQVQLVEEHRTALEDVGLALAPFGETSVSLSGVPARLRHVDAEGLVRDALEVIERRGAAPDAADVIEELLHRCACRSSVMAGDALGESEIRALLERAARLESDQTCPHSRPTRVRFSLADLEKAFHRR